MFVQTDLLTIQSDLDKAFWKFHKQNPEVYRQFVSLARQAKDRGRKRIGGKMLGEVIRWNRLITTTGSVYKINNNHISRYVRLIQDEYPELGELFETRSLHS